jgi:integrase
VLVDTGMRPEECYMGGHHLAQRPQRHPVRLVTHGKTKAARCVLPMTPRVRSILEQRWKGAGEPQEGWIWDAPTQSGHIEPSSLKKQHRRALRDSGVRQFVLYSLGHTFLTRLGESGCDAWTLAARYVHPSEDAVLSAVEKLSRHRIGHSDNMG